MIETRPLRDRFLDNLEAQVKSGSTYWIVLGGAALSIIASWPGLKDALDAIPIFKGYGLPISLMIGALVQKLVPSNVTTSTSQAQLLELGRLKFNEWARAQGIAEVPPDPTVTAKLPPIPISAPTSATPASGPAAQASAPTPAPEPAAAPAAAPPAPAAVDVDLEQPGSITIGSQVDPRLLLSLVSEYLKATLPKRA